MATPVGPNRATIDTRACAEATAGTATRVTPGRVACGVTTDSRAVVAGGAFVALRGDNHDGHDFVPRAIEDGALLIVVERGRAPADPRADVVEVDDTLEAWGRIAARHLGQWRSADEGRRAVGITGSAGKTTTKEICAALLRAIAPCHATAGNLNNRIGLPAVVLQLEPRHRFVVLEMGMSLRGEIAALAAIAPPDAAVVVNVGLAHAGGVGGGLADVAREKGAIFRGVREGGAIVVNADDAEVVREASCAPASRRRISFGRHEGADVRLVSRDAAGTEGSNVVVAHAGRTARFTMPIPGEAAAVDFVAALAAAEAVAGPLDDARIAAALAELRPIAGRMDIKRASSGFHVIDDAYNANPSSMRAALGALSEMAASRRVAVLGEMRELGAVAPGEHEALVDAVVRAGVALFVSCGGMADVIGRGAAERGVEVVFGGDAVGAAREIRRRVRPGDVVLVKASRSVGADRVVEELLRSGVGA